MPLTYFLYSYLVYGIYSRWALILSELNVKIQYIPSKRNVTADALLRAIFNKEYAGNDVLDSLGELGINKKGELK